MTRYLTIEEVLYLHYMIVEDFGGSHGVRDEGRLLSIEVAPRQEAFGVEQYGTVYEKAAVYCRNIIADHLFIDGNKRTGVTVAGVFLARNGVKLCASPEELEDFVVRIAIEHLEVEFIAEWLKQRSML